MEGLITTKCTRNVRFPSRQVSSTVFDSRDSPRSREVLARSWAILTDPREAGAGKSTASAALWLLYSLTKDLRRGKVDDGRVGQRGWIWAVHRYRDCGRRRLAQGGLVDG